MDTNSPETSQKLSEYLETLGIKDFSPETLGQASLGPELLDKVLGTIDQTSEESQKPIH